MRKVQKKKPRVPARGSDCVDLQRRCSVSRILRAGGELRQAEKWGGKQTFSVQGEKKPSRTLQPEALVGVQQRDRKSLQAVSVAEHGVASMAPCGC